MKIEIINPYTQPAVVEEIANIYQKVFGDLPWNEGYKCPACDSSFSLRIESKLCPNCIQQELHILLIPYWPVSKIISDFYHEMARNKSICIIGNINSEIIGFAWGYEIIMSEETDTYLGARGLSTKTGIKKFFYLDEVGIKPNNQCQGFGKKLLTAIFSLQNEKNIMLRTMKDSRMYFLIKNIGGREIFSITNSKSVIMVLHL